jgi:UDP-3-O-[3-hydroxymyristoyl] glucosamine N-acyltransferase
MFPHPTTAGQLASRLEATLEGPGDVELRGLAAIDQAGPGELTFASDARHARNLAKSRASAALVPVGLDVSAGCTLLRVANVELALNVILAEMAGEEDLPPVGVAASADVADDVQLGAEVRIGPGAVVGAGCRIGEGSALLPGVVLGRGVTVGQQCVLAENVTVRHGCAVGDRVRIGPGSVIGQDGYGYAHANGVHHKVPHAGSVVIEDDVELGACVCVDRAKWGATRIGAGAKIDNLVQIAHNVQVGPGCLLASQVGIAGSARLGRFVVMGGQVGIKDNIDIADGVEVGACACLPQSAGPGERLLGIPARDARQYLREQKALASLPELLRRVKHLEQQLGRTESD